MGHTYRNNDGRRPKWDKRNRNRKNKQCEEIFYEVPKTRFHPEPIPIDERKKP